MVAWLTLHHCGASLHISCLCQDAICQSTDMKFVIRRLCSQYDLCSLFVPYMMALIKSPPAFKEQQVAVSAWTWANVESTQRVLFTVILKSM